MGSCGVDDFRSLEHVRDCEDVLVWGCEDALVWGCESVLVCEVCVWLCVDCSGVRHTAQSDERWCFACLQISSQSVAL